MSFNPSNKKMKKIAVVLASGGVRALSAIPLFEFLNKAGIKIDHLYGSSAGALMACVHSMGTPSNEMKRLAQTIWKRALFEKFDYKMLLSLAGFPLSPTKNKAILKPFLLQKALYKLFGDKRLENLPIPVSIQTTDFNSAEGVILSEGLIADAVYASSADYPFLPPLKIGERWLVDGTFSAPLPINAATQSKPDVIIAMMYDSAPSECSNFQESYGSFFSKVYTNLRKPQLGLNMIMCETEVILIHVNFEKMIRIWDVENIDLVLETSALEIEKKKAEILNLCFTEN